MRADWKWTLAHEDVFYETVFIQTDKVITTYILYEELKKTTKKKPVNATPARNVRGGNPTGDRRFYTRSKKKKNP